MKTTILFPAFLQPGSSRNCRFLRRSRTRPCFALAIATLSLCGCVHERAPPRLTEVTVGTPIRQDVPVYSQWIGTTVGFIDAEIHSKVTGYLLAQADKPV
jgi:membrane fusion protein (multidrug efflux system)